MIPVKLRVLPSRRATLIKLAAQAGPVRTFGTRARACSDPGLGERTGARERKSGIKTTL
jgi:hypothetical protein